MNKERVALRNEKAKHKAQLTGLKNYIRELKAQCKDCGTAHEHISGDLMQAENDANFYETRIKSINERIKALARKAKQ